jgi:hypothetical protein
VIEDRVTDREHLERLALVRYDDRRVARRKFERIFVLGNSW